MENNILQCYLHFPREWAIMPRLNETPLEVEQFFRGQQAGEWLILSFMERADPQANLRNWLEPIIAISGFPFPTVAQVSKAVLTLKQWNYEGHNPALARKLQLDEIHLYRGLVARGRNPGLSRLFVFLGRQGNRAWKIGLSVALAVEEGEAVSLELADRRAESIFGHLRFLNPVS